jgi:hypothetical protein
VTEIDNVLTADASTVFDAFHMENGAAGFRIPVYQRQYNWDREHIERLLLDVRDGLFALQNRDENVTFIGSIILMRDVDRERTFKGQSLSVVDGQQRLTTLSITVSQLAIRLRQAKEEFHQPSDDPVVRAAKEEADELTDYLFSCCLGSPGGPRPRLHYGYFPRVIRSEDDRRGTRPGDAQYNSPIAEYLFQFCEHYLNYEADDFQFSATGPSEVSVPFSDRVRWIGNFLDMLANDAQDEGEAWPQLAQLMEKATIRRILFPNLQRNADAISGVLRGVRHAHSHTASRLLRLVAFGNYLLHRVALTHVVSQDESYAFSIFEALNTTGEPLTAIETFKPLVIESVGADEFGGSESYGALQELERYLSKIRSYDTRERESREIVVAHALYVNGEKLGRTLNAQRSYLRTRYSDAHSSEAKARFVRALAHISDFRARFWDRERILSQLPGQPEGRLALSCLHFIRDLGNSLAIPVLTRYWIVDSGSGDYGTFIGAVKAVTAFLVLRRAATGQTAGIDNDYRALMREGSRTRSTDSIPLCVGLDRQAHQVPPLDKLRTQLASFLEAPRLPGLTKTEWVEIASKQPLYTHAKSLCKFMLLCAAHNTSPDPAVPYLMKKSRPSPEKDLLNVETWRSRAAQTVEHIAPQNPREGWNDDLYDASRSTAQTIGNLTLLPEPENDALGNRPWQEKRHFYLAASADDNDELEQRIQDARDSGVNLTRRTRQILKEGDKLPLLSLISRSEEWTRHVVERRGENICSLVWDELAPWIGL